MEKIYKLAKPVNFVAFSDLHVEDYPNWNNQFRSRLQERIDFLKFMFKEADSINGHILFAGDLIDKAQSIKSHVLNALTDVFSWAEYEYPDVNFYAISGNHDMTTTDVKDSALVSFTKFKNFYLLDSKRILQIAPNVVIYGFPYRDSAQEVRTMLFSYSFEDAVNIVLTHQNDETQNKFSDNFITQKDFTTNSFVINGHIHQFYQNDNFVTVGNPCQQDINDNGEKFYLKCINGEVFRVLLENEKFYRKVVESKVLYQKEKVSLRPDEIFEHYCKNREVKTEIKEQGKTYIQW